MTHEPFISTGLIGLDEALEECLQPGNVIGVIGASGAGKTVLSSQIIRHALATLQGTQIQFISTEVSPEELGRRIVSATLSIPCNHADLDKEGEYLCRDGIGHLVPNPRKFEAPEIIRWKHFAKRINQVRYHHVPQPSADLSNVLGTVLHEFERDLRSEPGLVVLDYLDFNCFSGDEYTARQKMRDAMEAIVAASCRGKLLIFVFAQAVSANAGKRYLDLSDIADCRGLFDATDAFIGIGQDMGEDPHDDDDDGASREMYRESQSLNVLFPNGIGKGVRVPVTRRFEYQRFEDREEPERPRGGYLPFSRERFRDLCALGNPNAINVYAFLALFTRSGLGVLKSGFTWPSHKTIAAKTGLTVKQVRGAIDKLEKGGLVKKRRTFKSNEYRIQGWEIHHVASGATTQKKGYFSLFRRILDESAEPLFSKPATLRLWLYILANTQVFTHPKHWEIQRGHIALDFDVLEHELGLSMVDADEALAILDERGSIEILGGERVKNLIRVVNWDRYQPDA
ncbi:MAG: hypothetical protein KDN19_18650 [Verrucomicrobiae bacterium]|nr:hypothetical protein [Verrucomicrobiae bacterium]